MRAVLQRAASARVLVGDETVGAIGRGLAVFAAVGTGDTDDDLRWVAEKTANLRLFSAEGDDSHFARSLLEVGGAALAIPQFTLFGDARKGRRPSFDAAMRPPEASGAFDRFTEMLRALGIETATGRFGAMMRVEVAGDGPVTILLDSKKAF